MDNAVHTDIEVDHYHKWMTEQTQLNAIDRQIAWLELKGAMHNGRVIPDKYNTYMQVIAAHGKKYRLNREERAQRARDLADHFRRRFA